MDRELAGLIAEFDRAVVRWCEYPTWTIDAAYLTRLLVERGVWESLVAEWRAVGDHDPLAARRLAWALTEQGDSRGAQRALDLAADLGDLAVLATRAGQGGLRGRAARVRYERAQQRQARADVQAAAQGDPHAAYRRSLVLAAEAEEAAQRWHESGTRRGDPGFEALVGRMNKLSDASRALARQAEEGGSPEAVLAVCRKYYDRSNRIGDGGEPAPTVADLAREVLPEFIRADEMGLAEGSWYLGWALMELKKLDRAEAALRRAVDRGSTRAPSWLARVLTRRKPPDWAEAERVYRQAIDRGLPEYSGLAECLEHLGDTEAAELAWQQAAEHELISADWLRRKRSDARDRAARYRERARRREERARGRDH